jgi:hypothetical protein
MGKVITALAMSLDGFVAGPNDGPERPLGGGGERLFKWYFSGDTDVHMQGGPALKLSKESAQVLRSLFSTLGAMVAGRRMFDIANAWDGKPPGAPCFIFGIWHNFHQILAQIYFFDI